MLQVARRGLEGPAEERDVAEPGHLGHGVLVDVADQPADHDRLAVAHHHGVLDLAARERRADLVDVADVCLERLVDAGDLLEDVEAQAVALGDLGRHPQRHADVLALDVDGGREARSSVGVLTVVGVCTRLLMIGMLLPIRISASSLSEVRMCGAEMMLVPAS